MPLLLWVQRWLTSQPVWIQLSFPGDSLILPVMTKGHYLWVSVSETEMHLALGGVTDGFLESTVCDGACVHEHPRWGREGHEADSGRGTGRTATLAQWWPQLTPKGVLKTGESFRAALDRGRRVGPLYPTSVSRWVWAAGRGCDVGGDPSLWLRGAPKGLRWEDKTFIPEAWAELSITMSTPKGAYLSVLLSAIQGWHRGLGLTSSLPQLELMQWPSAL